MMFPTMTYDRETWALSSQAKKKLVAAKHGKKYVKDRDRKTHVWVRDANTLLNKSEDGSEPGQLECDVVLGKDVS